MTKLVKQLLVSTLALFLAVPSYAALITYTDQASYLSAIGGSADITENFNSFTSDQSFRNSSFDVGPFILSSAGSSQNLGTQNQIDVSPFSFIDFANIDDTPFAHFFLDENITTASVTFSSGITAFGALFNELSDNTSIAIETSAGSESITPAIGSGVSFFGFTLDPGVTLSSMTFSSGRLGDGFGMDDVLLSTNATQIPAPASFILLLSGFLLMQRRKG